MCYYLEGICPKCGGTTVQEQVDIGVGCVPCEPFHCLDCGWSETDDLNDMPYDVDDPFGIGDL